MPKESILVTGGDGNIGSEVINQLSSHGADLRIVGGRVKGRILTRDLIITI